MIKRKFVLPDLGWFIIIIVVALSVVGGMYGKNRTLSQQVKELQKQNSEYSNLIFELQMEASKSESHMGQLYIYVEELESKNQTLDSCCINK